MRARLATLFVAFLTLSPAGESVLATQERAQEPLDMGSRLELFVDDYLIESMDGVELKLHSPRSAGTALSEAPEPGASDTVFLTSRDQFHWDRRFLEAFIRPGRDRRNWMNRSNMVAFGVVATGSDEISLYVIRHFKFPSVHLQRMVLRTDGFVSARAGYGGGELITRPLVFQGESLLLNFATSAAGSIRVEIQDAEGNPLPGFALDDSPLIFGDQIEHKVGWDRSRSRKTSEEMLRRISGMPVRLRFVMKDADLYSLRFK